MLAVPPKVSDQRHWFLRSLVGFAGAALLLATPFPASLPRPALLTAAALQVFLGWPFYAGALRLWRAPTGWADSLVALASTLALVLAAAGRGIPAGTAALVLALASLGRGMGARALQRMDREPRRLEDRLPERVTIVRDGNPAEIPLAELSPGDLVRVPARGIVPVDGRIASGYARLDETFLLGDSLPSEKETPDPVTAGTQVLEGDLDVRAERVGSDTLLMRMGSLATQAQTSPSPFHPLATRLAALLAVSAVALAAFQVHAHAGGEGWSRAIAVLLAASPLALALSVSLPPAAGLALAVRQGILFRDAAAQRLAAAARRVQFHAETLLSGEAQVLWFHPASGQDPGTVMCHAASAERNCPHPIAKAIVKQAIGYGGNLDVPSKSQEIPGQGIAATLPTGEVLVGSPGFLRERGVDLEPILDRLTEAGSEGNDVACVAQAGKVTGFFALERVPRPDAGLAVRGLRQEGLEIGLFSADTPERAGNLGRTVGITEPRHGLPREARQQAFAETSRRVDAPVALVGDAARDAASLAAAPLGIAFGACTDLPDPPPAVVILGSDMRLLGRALSLARAGRDATRFGLSLAVALNLAALPLAAAGGLTPWQAAAVSMLAILAALAPAGWLAGQDPSDLPAHAGTRRATQA